MAEWQETEVNEFLKERAGRYKPDDPIVTKLKRLDKIDFSGVMHFSDKSSKTNMIIAKKGDLVISGINVAKGALAVYDGNNDITATIHYSSYQFDEEKINVEYFKRFLDEQKSVDIEALYIDDDVWKEISNKVHRILVESSDKERIGRIFNGKPHYIRGLHAKLIIGNSGLLVGSMNLGISSMENNRELSLWITNKKAIEYLNKIFDYDWREEYTPKGVMNIKIDEERVQIDLSKSKGEIEEYRVYIDGNLVYEGRNRRIKCTLKEGTHTVKVVLVDRWGNVDVVEGKITINKRVRVDIRIFVSILIFAVFFYKVWKAHR